MAFFLIAVLVVALDQLTKLWIRSNLAIGQSLPETGFFRLTYVHNTGAAFGLFQDQSFLLTIVASIGVVVLLVYALFIYRRFPRLDSRLGKSALGLVLERLTSDQKLLAQRSIETETSSAGVVE